MFNNIGGKLKTLAVVLSCIGIVGSFLTGLYVMSLDESLIFTGFVIMIAGGLTSWISSFMTYGIGQLIENSDILVQLHKKGQNPTPTIHTYVNPATNKFCSKCGTKLNSQGLCPNCSVTTATHTWKCPSCGNTISQEPCPFCNYSSVQPTNKTTFVGTCEKCGRQSMILRKAAININGNITELALCEYCINGDENPVIPDGFWRCMGCGKLIPENETTCECGYKKGH